PDCRAKASNRRSRYIGIQNTTDEFTILNFQFSFSCGDIIVYRADVGRRELRTQNSKLNTQNSKNRGGAPPRLYWSLVTVNIPDAIQG
ncbi:MAG: hypothetical protein P8Y93_12445, partial [Acidobacteriota bacterium]